MVLLQVDYRFRQDVVDSFLSGPAWAEWSSAFWAALWQ